MSVKDGTTLSGPEEQAESNGPTGMQYKHVLKTTEEQGKGTALPVDFRHVPHGHGPCSCCGPYSE
jgi:hypothetical protein